MAAVLRILSPRRPCRRLTPCSVRFVIAAVAHCHCGPVSARAGISRRHEHSGDAVSPQLGVALGVHAAHVQVARLVAV